MKNKTLWFLFLVLFLAATAFSQVPAKPQLTFIGKRANDTAAGSCSAARKGYVYYNTTSNTFLFCNGTAWGSLGGSSLPSITDSGTLVTSTSPIQLPNGTFSNLALRNSAGAGFYFNGGTTGIIFNSTSAALDARINNGFQTISTGQFTFTPGGDPTVAPDIGIARTAVGVAKISDGSSGSGWLQTAGNSRVSGNVTNATATMAAITGLSATVVSGRKYAGELMIIAKNSTAAEGLQFDLNGGAATFTNIEFMFQATPPGVTLGTTVSTVAGTAITATTATTTDVVYTIYFTCVVNVGGTVIPRFAEVTHTSGTATAVLGSSMQLTDIP